MKLICQVIVLIVLILTHVVFFFKSKKKDELGIKREAFFFTKRQELEEEQEFPIENILSWLWMTYKKQYKSYVLDLLVSWGLILISLVALIVMFVADIYRDLTATHAAILCILVICDQREISKNISQIKNLTKETVFDTLKNHEAKFWIYFKALYALGAIVFTLGLFKLIS